ncbi:RBBP9/YdeN family alpha/beta hydrolase [Streptomyces sp. NPDC101132]|uniref:RBBP9/YdeN family alpha/beta hydrolase n=1 Tax=Streptomyces sp. NPDC101132 TaxID=3366110 RepID=UPI003809765F
MRMTDPAHTGDGAPEGGRSHLLLHGWQNRRPEGHWQRVLADGLTARGHQVRHPQLPDPDAPRLDAWLATLERELGALDGAERTVVCHSLGVLLWLHAAARGAVSRPVDRVLLVAPPSASVLAGHPEIAGFAPPELGPGLPAAAARSTRLVCGDVDPYCPEGAVAEYAEPLGIPVDVLPGAGHISMTEGYGPWPAVLDWCLDPSAALTARPEEAGAGAM